MFNICHMRGKKVVPHVWDNFDIAFTVVLFIAEQNGVEKWSSMSSLKVKRPFKVTGDPVGWDKGDVVKYWG